MKAITNTKRERAMTWGKKLPIITPMLVPRSKRGIKTVAIS